MTWSMCSNISKPIPPFSYKIMLEQVRTIICLVSHSFYFYLLIFQLSLLNIFPSLPSGLRLLAHFFLRHLHVQVRKQTNTDAVQHKTVIHASKIINIYHMYMSKRIDLIEYHRFEEKLPFFIHSINQNSVKVTECNHLS